MTAERHALAKDIFLAALSCPPAERAAFLERRCGSDGSLRAEVEQLLAHHDEQTITPPSQAPTVPTDAWRQAGSRLDLENQGAGHPEARPDRSLRPPDPQEFAPGTVIADRYRIVSELGRGGMGVVYRAEDLTLEQPVALKFLSPAMASHPGWIELFRNEVRLAREVTHANVCRVYDIGEVDGTVFLSMEYVDGEDLTSLIKRIGRLPREKAIDIARQLCIGLAAAHGVGVLHRDLKPANVMLDGRGQVRITDFGLAVAPDSVKVRDVRSGTPAYMAPEQISGREVSVQSDIYALGLVIYELFSGRPAFEAETIEEFVELHRSSQPVPLSKIVEDVDPAVERIIDLCLSKHPHDRPRSALAVAAALPGTDPLAAALAANLTPSPEMVAAGRPIHSRLMGAKTLLLMVVILFAGYAAARTHARFPWESSDSKPPAVLAERARNFIKEAQFAWPALDSAYGYCKLNEAMALATGTSDASESRSVLAAGLDSSLVFWYRQSSDKLIPTDAKNVTFGSGRVTPTDPSPLQRGSVSVALDLSGRLLLLVARAGRIAKSDEPPKEDASRKLWEPSLRFAGLEEADLTITEPAEDLGVEADQRFAWLAPDPRGSGTSVRVDFSARNGKPAFFAVRTSDDSTQLFDRMTDLRRRRALSKTSLQLLLVAVSLVAIPGAWRNFRSGRSDRRGAWRLALVVGSLQLASWLLQAEHTIDFDAELLSTCMAVMRALGTAALVTVFYTALEPYARRHWPQMLITWTRALSGDLRDPVVGQHMLIGVCLGCFWAMMRAADRAFVHSMGWSARHSLVSGRFADKLVSIRVAIADYLEAIPVAIVEGLLFLLLLAALRAFVRRPLWAAALSVLVLLPIVLPSGAHIGTTLVVMGVGGAGVGVWAMTRFGLLTLTIGLFVGFVLNTSPVTIDFSQWYADITFCAMVIVGALTAYAFWTASGRPAAE